MCLSARNQSSKWKVSSNINNSSKRENIRAKTGWVLSTTWGEGKEKEEAARLMVCCCPSRVKLQFTTALEANEVFTLYLQCSGGRERDDKGECLGMPLKSRDLDVRPGGQFDTDML